MSPLNVAVWERSTMSGRVAVTPEVGRHAVFRPFSAGSSLLTELPLSNEICGVRISCSSRINFFSSPRVPQPPSIELDSN